MYHETSGLSIFFGKVFTEYRNNATYK